MRDCVGFNNENKKGKHSRPACYIVDDARVSRSSRVRKSIVSGKSC